MNPIPAESGRRVRLSAFGETAEDALARLLRLEPMARPDPASLGAHDVLVAVRSASVALIDGMMLSGQYHHKPAVPYTPGMEYAGVVEWVGPAVDPARFQVGDRVMNDYQRAGPRSAGAHQAQGGWATHAVASQDGLLPVPEGLSFDEACNFLLNYETAHYAFVTRGRLAAGETVLVNGASGAAGLAAVQVAKLLGAQVIAAGRSDAKLAEVKAAGADHVINVSPRPGESGVPRFRDEVKALTGGRGADLVFDVVGGAVSQECLRSLAFGGRLVIIGWASNQGVSAGGGRGGSLQPDLLPTNIVQMKGLVVMGSPMVIAGAHAPQVRVERLCTVLQWGAQRQVVPIVQRAYPLEQYDEALRARLGGDIVGGCVLHP